nr:anhydro-N-acetylmuramic acid kinase [Allomuricauda sp.]
MTNYTVLGMMSGTSLDGLDLAVCHLSWLDGQWKFSIGETREVPYEQLLREQLKNAIFLSDEAHGKLHRDYGIWLGQQAKQFINEKQLEVDFIASHGHTSHHRPEDGFTFQLGEGQLLANSCGKQVVCDFRTMDVSLGGQGAPLVPIGDTFLFSEYDFCLNLGGISNMSFEKEGQRIAYDIGLANMPLNLITRRMGLEYDDNGKLARSGTLDDNLLAQLNALGYYKLPYPKSTGYEWFTSEIVPLIEGSNASNEDLLHTFIDHNCEQIARQVQLHNSGHPLQLLVTGGGALNQFFVDTLQEHLADNVTVVVPDKKLIAYKEALVFAFMGVLKVRGEINVLSSVTGARKDSSSGEVFYPKS